MEMYCRGGPALVAAGRNGNVKRNLWGKEGERRGTGRDREKTPVGGGE